MLTVYADPHELIALSEQLESQFPYATAKALNEVATGFQGDERGVIQRGMTIRRPWVLQGVKIDRGDFATKQKLSVRVQISPDRDFLDKFEEGGTRFPRGSGRSLAVPIAVRRTKTQIIRRDETPKSFDFQQAFSSRSSRWTIFKGERGAFILQRPDGSGILLQRTRRPQLGPSRYGNRNLVRRRAYGHDPNLIIKWALRPTTPVPSLLHFHQTAIDSFLSRWPGSFRKWYLESLRTAR